MYISTIADKICCGQGRWPQGIFSLSTLRAALKGLQIGRLKHREEKAAISFGYTEDQFGSDNYK
jgi:hypothetical protein